ncbi:DeoR/GlpR family DNA-binding transcription regulator [Thermanaerothrix sp. 4228-RoL]|uniref:DeoR/GlpR family DNA-binding transcription regulator n=1 Tax=Thermanaerothrix solaris TaxID=3058434 RepID=A0ABU3NN42_9CHLR|nr:DeoR/GlpR family DNA-binding transcription regulator [Thermanaerothrix sp. 4228-RoL]MDT8898252.1 DeoR/GlpR family DNA-binding transcription regulator [Thermanaerothrix sp. 4228-RoL]
MNTAERQAKIVEMVLEKGSISIAEIASLFNVSEMTARRDLNELDRQGLVRRVHGGAVANLGRSYEPPFSTRVTKNHAAKQAIGRAAADLIYDGDSIALDVGSTTLEIVPHLKTKRNLTIVTSCLQIANAVVNHLSLEVDARLILTGGIVRPRELSMIGAIAERIYNELHVDKAFIGVGGISLDDGLTEYNFEDTQIKKVLLRTAREKIVVADSSKFGVTAFASIAPLTAIDCLITDDKVSPEIVEALQQAGIKVIIAHTTPAL